MGEFASKGMAGTALGFGIGGTALSLLNNSGCGNGGGGLLGNLFGCGNNNNCCESKESALLRQENSTLRSERYADQVGISAYRDAIAINSKNDEKMNLNFKEVYQALADLDKKEAVNQANISCLYNTLDNKINAVQTELLGDIKCLGINTNTRFEALRTETAQAIALEGERRECGDKNLYEYVNGHFVKGNLITPLSSICPPAAPACGKI